MQGYVSLLKFPKVPEETGYTILRARDAPEAIRLSRH
jgi:hypothetical protein